MMIILEIQPIKMNDFDRSYEENKKKFWKKVRRERNGGSRTEETVKDVNGRLL